jgi:hypothetical protein
VQFYNFPTFQSSVGAAFLEFSISDGVANISWVELGGTHERYSMQFDLMDKGISRLQRMGTALLKTPKQKK